MRASLFGGLVGCVGLSVLAGHVFAQSGTSAKAKPGAAKSLPLATAKKLPLATAKAKTTLQTAPLSLSSTSSGKGKDAGNAKHLSADALEKLAGKGKQPLPDPKGRLLSSTTLSKNRTGLSGSGKLSGKQKTVIIQIIQKNKATLSSAEKNALEKVAAGERLSAAERQVLSGMLTQRQHELTAEEREALSQALTDDAEQPQTAYTRRYLKVYNATGEKLRIWVQYQTLTNKNRWVWYPADPAKSVDAVQYDVRPGEAVYLEHDKWRINACRVRIWARSSNGREWRDFQTRDFWLVPEINARGERRYLASEMGTWTFTFTAGTGVAAR